MFASLRGYQEVSTGSLGITKGPTMTVQSHLDRRGRPFADERAFSRTGAHWTSTSTERPSAIGRWRNALCARYSVYRKNREFRRHQREFQHAMDCVAHDPAGQRELGLSWSLRD